MTSLEPRKRWQEITGHGLSRGTQQKLLKHFLNKSRSVQWFYVDPFRIHLRISERYFQEEPGKTLEISTVVIDDLSLRGRGEFSLFLAWLEKEAAVVDISFIFIENVLDLRFRNFFLRHGYTELPYYLPTLACMVKRIKQKEPRE